MHNLSRKHIIRNRLGVLDNKYIVKTSENYRGLSYSDIIIRWQRWLLSGKPDYHQYGDILFLRGSIGYHRSNSKYFHSSVKIAQGVAILVPVVTTLYCLGDNYDGQIIKDEFYLRKAVREHVDAAGPFWATLSINDNKVVRIARNLEKFRVESMLFELNISEQNPFLDRMDERVFPGDYTASVGGYFIILHDLPASSYKVRFGGYGMDKFFTESLYEIEITTRKRSAEDISGPDYTPDHLLTEKKNPVKTIIRML
jgi:hypothetical protein